MATALKLKRDINKLKAAIKSKATPQSYVPKLKAQLEKAEADYESVKSGKRSVPKASKQVKSTLDKLKQIIKKKKYGAYRAQGVDLKKDADRPALPTGKRISKNGNTYYEYRANRIDVKQPPKRYPKLEDGGMMDDGRELYKVVGKKNGQLVDITELPMTKNDALKWIKEQGVEKYYTNVDVIRYRGSKEAFKMSKGGYMEDGGGTDMLKEDDMVWNAVGNKLEVYKVTKDEYYLKGFMQPSPMPFSKKKVHNYLKMGEWSLKPKMADGGTIDNSGITPADLQKQIWNLTARIAKLGDIESQASYDEINMLMKQRKKLQSMALNHGDVVMAQGGELHRIQEEKFKYGGYMSEGGNTDEEKQIFFFVKPRMVNELTQKANNENVELEFIETNEDGNEVYRAELTDAQINHFTKLPLQYDFEYDYAKGGYMSEGGNTDEEKQIFFFVKPRMVNELTQKANNENVELEFIETNEDGNEVYRAELTDAQINHFTKLPLQYDFEYDYAKGGYMAHGGKLDSGVYRVGKPRKVLPMLYEQKIVEIFDNGDIATASDYARKLNDFKVQSYPIITNEQLEAQYKMEKGGYMSKGGETVPYIIWVSKDGEKREFYGTYKSQRAADMAMRKLWDSSDYKSMGNKPKKMYEKEGFYAKGGATEHGLKKGDTIWADQFWDNTVIVDNPKTGRAVVNLETGKRKEQGKI